MSSNSRRESSPECKQCKQWHHMMCVCICVLFLYSVVQSGQQANKYLVVHNQSFAVLG